MKLPSSSWITPSTFMSCSSAMSPTISSRMSSSVTTPISAPYSSTTMAKCSRRRLNASSCFSSVVPSGMNHGLARQLDDVDALQLPVVGVQRAQQALGMQHADDVVRLVAPQRDAGVLAVQHLAHDLLRRQVGVDHGHVAPVDHDVGDRHLVEVQDRMQHRAGFADLLGRFRNAGRSRRAVPRCSPRRPARARTLTPDQPQDAVDDDLRQVGERDR